MKKLIASSLMVLFAGSAFAAETAYVIQPLSGPEYVEPCNNEGPTPANGLCGDGRVCPVGYEETAKYCWSGGGFEQCGMTCKNNHIYDHH